MRVLYAYNQHRGQWGGGDHAALATAACLRGHGMEVEVYTRISDEVAHSLPGRIGAALNVLYAPASVRKIGELIQSFRPDVVHIHEVFPLVSSWIMPECTRRDVPVVCTIIDYRLTCPIVTHSYKGATCTRCATDGEHWAVLRNCRGSLPESVMVAVYNGMNRKLGLFRDHVSVFIAPSAFTRDWMIRYGQFDPDRVVIVDPIVEALPPPADPAKGEYVAFAGRLTKEKGVPTFLEASRICPVPFRLARHERSVAQMEIPPDADVVVTRNPQELDVFYRGARMLVVPSLWFETFGLVGAEAMARGIPVIVSRIGAVQNLIEDGVNGLLFEPGNVSDLASKVMRLWNDPDLCRRLGAAARQKALSEWTVDRHYQNTKSVYEKAIGHPVGRHRAQNRRS